MQKRVLSLFLALILVLSAFPAAWAVEAETAPAQTAAERADEAEAAQVPAEEADALPDAAADAEPALPQAAGPAADGTNEVVTSGDWTYNINSGVATIAKYNGSAASVTLPTKATINGSSYNLRQVDAKAFEGNTTLQSVTIPKEYTKLGNAAFRNCANLKSITINGDLGDAGTDSAYAGGDWSANTSIFFNTGANTDGITVTFGSGVTRVPNYLFATGKEKSENVYPRVTKVVLPATVTEIGTYAFYRCYDLKTVQFSASGSLSAIRSRAFQDCISLASLSLPASLTLIEERAFINCSALKEFNAPTGLVTINGWAFENCTALQKVTLSKTVSKLGNCVFKSCTTLSSITINGDIADAGTDSAYPSGDWSANTSIFFNTGANTDGITVTFGSGVTRVGAYLFATGKEKSENVYPHITKIVFSGTVAEIASHAFYRCYDLKTIQFGTAGKLADIGDYAFSNCTGLTSLSLPAGLQTVRNNAFEACTAIASLSLPLGMQSIGERAFKDCTSLTKFTAPTGLSSIGGWAFENCSALQTVVLSETVSSLGNCVFKNCIVLGSITINGNLGDAHSDSAYAGGDWSSNTSIFFNTGYNTGGISVTFGEGVTRIPNYLFATGKEKSENVYSHVKTVYLPSTLQEIGKYAFYHCFDLTSVNYNGTAAKFNSVTVGENNDPLTGATFFYPSSPKITTQPSSATVAVGEETTFKVVASGKYLQYQWQYKKKTDTSWTNWSGGNSASLTVRGTTTNGGCQYRCVVKNGAGSVISNAATLTVTSVAKPVITTHPVSVTANLGEVVTFKVVATGTGLKYQWQYMKSGETAWSNWSGKTSASVSVTASTTNNGCKYRCVVSNAGGSVNSNAATLTVSTVAKPTITTQPKSATVYLGESTTFKVVASGSGLSYKWQYKKVGESSWTDYYGGTTASITVKGSNTNNGCQYRCVVSNAGGSVTSSAATLTVVSVAAPVITTQPKSATVYLGENATFKVVASGSGLSYKWQYKKVGESSWTDYYGGTTASITVKASNTNGGCQYRCVVSNAGGSVTSSAATLTVQQVAKPVITAQPKSATVYLGESATFSVTASGTGLSYQWQFSKDTGGNWYDWAGKTGSSVTVTGSATNNGCLYRCVVSNAGGSVISGGAMLTVVQVDPPVITAHPRSVSVTYNSSTTFSVTASGVSLTYQWQSSKDNGASWSNCDSGTSRMFTVKATEETDGCLYRCIVSNPGGSVTSTSAKLTVTGYPAPVITSQPQSISMGVGGHATFTVVAKGVGLTYQWQRSTSSTSGFANISGATAPNLIVAVSSVSTYRYYRCIVRNNSGSVTSSVATLTIVANHDCPGKDFVDMPSVGTTEHNAIDWAISQSPAIATGTSSTTFSPNKTVTRGQAVTFLWRAAGEPAPKTTRSPFTDVSSSSYCYKAVLWANENNITNGTSATTFSPNKTCNRAQILTFLFRFMGSPSANLSSVNPPYTDVKAGAYYEMAMKWAYFYRIDRGITTTTFAPEQDCTRVSTVVFLYRVFTNQGLAN